ncbi:hypothetical protein V5T82_07515 [Magnetovibrio sp. PR-2]|uniref:hypothetical protein n=1 Tax=Magnetovibrio sp. PR-2 TaxID=3120356 RepID=UPI002FCDE24C
MKNNLFTIFYFQMKSALVFGVLATTVAISMTLQPLADDKPNNVKAKSPAKSTNCMTQSGEYTEMEALYAYINTLGTLVDKKNDGQTPTQDEDNHPATKHPVLDLTEYNKILDCLKKPANSVERKGPTKQHHDLPQAVKGHRSIPSKNEMFERPAQVSERAASTSSSLLPYNPLEERLNNLHAEKFEARLTEHIRWRLGGYEGSQATFVIENITIKADLDYNHTAVEQAQLDAFFKAEEWKAKKLKELKEHPLTNQNVTYKFVMPIPFLTAADNPIDDAKKIRSINVQLHVKELMKLNANGKYARHPLDDAAIEKLDQTLRTIIRYDEERGDSIKIFAGNEDRTPRYGICAWLPEIFC